MIISKNRLACLHFLKVFFYPPNCQGCFARNYVNSLIPNFVRREEAERRIRAKLSREIASKITLDEKSQMESDGGIDINELNEVLSKSNIKPSADISEKFNKLDTNKNGKLEESEVKSTTEGGEDFRFFTFVNGGAIYTPSWPFLQNIKY